MNYKLLSLILLFLSSVASAQNNSQSDERHDPFGGTAIDQVFGEKVAPEKDIIRQAKDRAAGKPGISDFSIKSVFKRNQDELLIHKKEEVSPDWVDLKKTGKDDEFKEAYRNYEKTSDYKIRKELEKKDPEEDDFGSKMNSIEERLNKSNSKSDKDKKGKDKKEEDSLEKKLKDKKEKELHEREDRIKKKEEELDKQKEKELDDSQKELERVFK